LTTVPLIPPVPAQAKIRLKERRKTATSSEETPNVNRIDASNDKYPYFSAWARRDNVIQQLAADTRPGRDLAVLRDVALAGGIRCDRK
jgi:hypothetical protein